MGLLSAFAGAASTAALFHYVRNVRSVAPPALLGAVARRAIDAQQIDIVISPPAAARYAALVASSRKLVSSSDNVASSLKPLLARSFFGSRAFQPERAVLAALFRKDVSNEKLKDLAWTPGDRFGLWTVAPCEQHDALMLDWELPSARAWGKQVIRAELVDGSSLRVTLATAIQFGDSGSIVRASRDALHAPRATSSSGSQRDQTAGGAEVDGPIESLRQAGLHIAQFLHILYSRVLTRSLAETLRREL